MRTMTRILAFAVFAAMLVGLVAGCSQTQPTGSAAGSATANATTVAATTAAAATAAPPTTPPIRTLTVLCADNRANFAAHKLADRDKYPVYKKFEEILAARGLALEYETVAGDQLKLVTQTRLSAGGALPNIINLDMDQATAIRYGKDGIFADVKKAVDQYDKDGSIFALWDQYFPSAKGMLTAEDGAIYWFPYLYTNNVVDATPDQPYKGTCYTLSIRKDWLDALQIPYKQVMTADELYQALAAFRDQDANKNGVQDETIAPRFIDLSNGMAQGFGLPTRLVSVLEGSDKVQCAWYMPHIKDYILYMKKLVDSGVYDTAVLDWAVNDQMLAENKIGLIYNYNCETWLEPRPGVEGVEYAPILLDGGVGNQMVLNRQGLEGSTGMWAVTSGTDMEAAIDLFDFIYSMDYYRLSHWGVEGVTYTVEADGTRRTTDKTEYMNDSSYTLGPLDYLIGQNALPDLGITDYTLDVLFNQTTFDSKNAMEKYLQTVDAVDDDALQKLALPTDAELETVTKDEQVLNTYSQELLTDLILGRKSVDDLDKYIGEMKSLGLDDYIAVFQARYDRFKAAAK